MAGRHWFLKDPGSKTRRQKLILKRLPVELLICSYSKISQEISKNRLNNIKIIVLFEQNKKKLIDPV